MARLVAGKPPFYFFLSLLVLLCLYSLRVYQQAKEDGGISNAVLPGVLSGSSDKNRCSTIKRVLPRSECECWAKWKHRSRNDNTLGGNHSIHPLVKEVGNGVIVNEFLGEIAYELAVFIPLVHYFHKNNRLISSASCDELKSFYFFSRNHTVISNCHRTNSKESVRAYENELGTISSRSFHPQFLTPPLKNAYCGCKPLWNKLKGLAKVVVITNMFTKEWQGNPLNFINLANLIRIIDLFLKNDFLVIYNRPEIYSSLDKPRYLSKRADFSKLVTTFGKSKSFIFMHSLAHKYPDLSLNEVTTRTMSLSRCFLSVKGEPSIISSYFGGWNIVLARLGHEARDGDYANFYHRYSGARVDHAKNVEEMEELAAEMAMSTLCNVTIPRFQF